MMEACVRSARDAGVFKDFNVMTDRPIPGCECYDSHKVEKSFGLFKLIYLKSAISKLNYDYFIWIDADSIFVNNPGSPLVAMRSSPIHAPLNEKLSMTPELLLEDGLTCKQLSALMQHHGLTNPAYSSTSAFWIIHHDAIDTVYDLALEFFHKAKSEGSILQISSILGYAMQMLCGNPEAHRRRRNPDLWATDFHNVAPNSIEDDQQWRYRDMFCSDEQFINPGIIHVPRRKSLPVPEQANSHPGQLEARAVDG
jgi:hypothetical protein